MPNLIIDLEVDSVDLVDEGANSQAFIKLYKRKENKPAMLTFEEILKSIKPEHVTVIMAEIEKARAEVPENVTTDLAKAKADLVAIQGKLDVEVAKVKGVPTEEEILKNADPAIQLLFKSLKAQNVAAEAVAAEALAKSKEDEAIAKAKDLKGLPVDDTKLVEITKSVSNEVFEILKTASKAVEEGMLTEVGKAKPQAGETSTSSKDAWSKIEKAAGDIAKAEGITIEKAIGRAIADNKDLYKQYLEGGAN